MTSDSGFCTEHSGNVLSLLLGAWSIHCEEEATQQPGARIVQGLRRGQPTKPLSGSVFHQSAAASSQPAGYVSKSNVPRPSGRRHAPSYNPLLEFPQRHFLHSHKPQIQRENTQTPPPRSSPEAVPKSRCKKSMLSLNSISAIIPKKAMNIMIPKNE